MLLIACGWGVSSFNEIATHRSFWEPLHSWVAGYAAVSARSYDLNWALCGKCNISNNRSSLYYSWYINEWIHLPPIGTTPNCEAWNICKNLFAAASSKERLKQKYLLFFSNVLWAEWRWSSFTLSTLCRISHYTIAALSRFVDSVASTGRFKCWHWQTSTSKT